ncbi:hypothetical protein ABH15_09615 [Methanoculleus taiwanensis]|uniref:Uncharacterized protein n=1 Tax=Methanoculleus taiwanensis TaxID=1550565 RepID=A0A498H125_9EURY|nr:hypothetical protein [Methanoculleus taiwanensis]RXE56353.1 hypothetical protein ABH15_09615 [Methanoculleus taiwanensis]
MESFKQEIYEFIASSGDVSFVELHDRFGERFTGEYTMFSSPNSKIVLWDDVSGEFIGAIGELMVEGKIGIRYDSEIYSLYAERGVALPYPLAKNPTRDVYAQFHWLPVIMSAK